MKHIAKMDATAVETFIDLLTEYKARGVTVCLVKLKPELKQVFFMSGLIDVNGKRIQSNGNLNWFFVAFFFFLKALGAHHIFSRTSDAVLFVEKASVSYSTYADFNLPTHASISNFDNNNNNNNNQVNGQNQ